MKNKKSTVTLIALTAVILIVCFAYIFIQRLENDDKPENETTAEITEAATTEKEEESTEPETTEETEPSLPENPANFEELQKQNEHVVGWIKVPGAIVDYPIVRHPEIEEYYLRRNWLGDYDVCGCIFIQNLNAADFSDPNTVIYGHYMYNGRFFGSLHSYRDAQYFKENPYFYIYTPGHILKYEIFASYVTNNDHLLYAYDFKDPEEFEKYLDGVMNTPTDTKITNPDIELDRDSKIVTLSTCVENGDSNYRYLVQGVLIEDTETK